MSEVDREIMPGARRLERIRDEVGIPVRAAPIGALALVGGALGTWWGGTADAALALVSGSLAAAGATGVPVDGAGELRAAVLACARLAAPACACAALGAWLGALVQGAGRWRKRTARRGRAPTAADAGGAVVRASWALAMLAAAASAVAMHAGRLAAMPALPLRDGMQAAGSVVLDAVLAALAAGAMFAAADVIVARWRWVRAARMGAAEAREERRAEDGDPALRARRRAAARGLIAGAARGREQRARAA